MEEREANAELAEAVDRFGTDLQRLLDQRAESTSMEPELLNAVFREAHSIKGLAGLFGHSRLGALAHAAEDLLDGLRMGRVVFGDEIEELLIAMPEALAARLEIGDAGAELDEGSALAQRARLALEDGQTPVIVAPPEIPPELSALLTTYEEHRLTHNATLGYGIYAVRAMLPLATFDRELRALRPQVQRFGEILATLPLPDEMTGDTLACELLLATPQGAAEIEHELDPALRLRILRPSTVTRAPAAPARPQQSVRVDIRKLDRMMETLSEIELVRLNLMRIAARLGLARAPALLVAEILQEARKLERRSSELQDVALEARMVPLTPLFTRTKRMVERVARELGKEVDVQMAGGDVEIDKLLAEALAEPLVHLTRNAVDHGIETPAERVARGKPRRGTVMLTASQRGGMVLLEVRDDGAGIDAERVRRVAVQRELIAPDESATLSHRDLVRLLLTPGFSTSVGVSPVSGRGVGLDAVRERVVEFAGFLEVSSTLGEGSLFSVALPATLALLRSMVVRVRGRSYALPVSAIWEVVSLQPAEALSVELGRESGPLPLVALGDLFELGGEPSRRPAALVVGPSEQRVGLVIDGLVGQRDLVAKPLGPALGSIPGIAGFAALGPEQPVLVLDVAALVDEALGRPALRRTA